MLSHRIPSGRICAVRILRCTIAALTALPVLALAEATEQEQCQTAAGAMLIGNVVSGPTYKHGKLRRGVELSHTHLTLRSDADGKTYDVAIDNVFAAGYDRGTKDVPAPLSSIAVGDRLEVCGQRFAGGIHWVHNNCGDSPTPQDPDGWVKKLLPDGKAGPNLESSHSYCYLWPHR